MSTYYSNVFTGINATTATNINGTSATRRGSAGNQHARTRTSIGHIRFDGTTANFTTADVAHMFLMKPNDRLLKLELAADDFGTGGSVDIGVYEVIERDGSLVFTLADADVFASAVVLNTSDTAWTNVMHESGFVPIEYVGRPMWEIVGLNTTAYTENTTKLFSVSVTPTVNSTATNIDLILMATYIAGD